MRACVLGLLLASIASAAPSDPVAVCGDATIVRGEVDAVLQRLGMAELPAGEQRLRAEAAVLEQLVDERLLRIELGRAGIGATELEIDAGVERLRERLAGRGGDLAAVLAASGRDERSLRDQVALEIALDKFVAPRLSAEALQEVFESRRRDFDGTRLRVSHVLLRPEGGTDEAAIGRLLERATAIRRSIVQGVTSFEEAASEHSAGPSRRRGGDLGFIGRDEPMGEPFSSRAFALAKGEVSEPFASPFGVHIVKVTEVTAGRIGLDAVRPRIEKVLATTLVQQLVAAARARNRVEVFPGVAYFDPATAGEPAASRKVLVAAEPAAE